MFPEVGSTNVVCSSDIMGCEACCVKHSCAPQLQLSAGLPRVGSPSVVCSSSTGVLAEPTPDRWDVMLCLLPLWSTKCLVAVACDVAGHNIPGVKQAVSQGKASRERAGQGASRPPGWHRSCDHGCTAEVPLPAALPNPMSPAALHHSRRPQETQLCTVEASLPGS